MLPISTIIDNQAYGTYPTILDHMCDIPEQTLDYNTVYMKL